MRVLVTGGSGFIGSHVVDAVRAAGHEPVIFDVIPSPYSEHAEVEAVVGSVLDPDALADGMRGCDAVAHMAAAADVDEVTKNPVGSEDLNARGTLNVLEAARQAGVERVLYASTIWVYGASAAGETVDEDTPLGTPEHLYTATKLAGEMYCRSYSALYGLDTTILRFGIPYGPRARAAAVVPAFVGKALAGEALTIAGTGDQCRRFVYVEDLAAGVAAALRPAASNRVYNLVGEEDVSIKRIAQTVSHIVGDTEVRHVPARAGDFKGVEVSGARAERELGWSATTAFDEGIRRYVDWRREAEARPAAPAASRSRRLPERRRVAAGGLFVAASGLLGAYLAALHAAGVEALVTMLAASLLAVVLVTLGTRERGGLAGPGLAWVVAGAAVLASLVPELRLLLGLDHLTATLVLLALAGAGFSVALALGGLRQRGALREPEERPADSGS
jgi:UDP-glucose 4-epimerase